jgi:hypothetical protein
LQQKGGEKKRNCRKTKGKMGMSTLGYLVSKGKQNNKKSKKKKYILIAAREMMSVSKDRELEMAKQDNRRPCARGRGDTTGKVHPHKRSLSTEKF